MFRSRNHKTLLTRSRQRSPHPTGFSLLEVVLAMAIFFGAAAVLSQLLLIGARTARWGEAMTEATLRCESTMAELVSGTIPLERREEIPFLDDPDWEYSVEIMPTPIPSLVRITVSARHHTGEKQDVQASLARLLATDEASDAFSIVAYDSASLAPGGASSQDHQEEHAPLSVEEMLGLSEEAP